MSLVVYHSPGSCSRVTLIALEEIGVGFEETALALMQGDQRAPAFLALNPKGKVPVLLADAVAITETPAIIAFLAHRFPAAGLLPATGNEARDLQGLSDLIWCAGVLHPLAHRFFRPGVYAPSAPDSVRATAADQLRREAGELAMRLAHQPWWYGERWSVMDAYIGWVFTVAGIFGLDLHDSPAIGEHRARNEARPAFNRALQRERDAVRRQSIPLPPGMVI